MRQAKKIREEARMTQEQVADQLGVDRSAVAHFERGYSDLRAKNLLALADVYSLSLGRTVTPSDLIQTIEEAVVGS